MAVHALAFGGSGSVPGAANEAIAKVAAQMGKGKLILAEPELGPALTRHMAAAEVSRFVFKVPEPKKRRGYLPSATLDLFDGWLRADPERYSRAIVLLGDANTAETQSSAPVPAGWWAQLLHNPAVQQAALFMGIPLEHAPKYRSFEWIARQTAQLARVAKIDEVTLVGQQFHVRDYALAWAKIEYQRFGIEVSGDSNAEHAEELDVWDPSSNQTWVQNADNWHTFRLTGTKLAAFVFPRTHKLMHRTPPGMSAAD